MKPLDVIITVCAFCAGNFIYQMFAGQKWTVALERSWFQMIFAAWIAFKLWRAQ
jgi:hypothetical protein